MHDRLRPEILLPTPKTFDDHAERMAVEDFELDLDDDLEDDEGDGDLPWDALHLGINPDGGSGQESVHP